MTPPFNLTWRKVGQGIWAILIGGSISFLGTLGFFGLWFTTKIFPIVLGPVTLTQRLFILDFFLFAPLLGMLCGIVVFRRSRGQPLAILRSGSSFIFTIQAAYLGWIFSGNAALTFFPEYPRVSPGELTASLFALPGFATGAVAALLMMNFHSRPAIWKVGLAMLASSFMACAGICFLLILMMPRQD